MWKDETEFRERRVPARRAPARSVLQAALDRGHRGDRDAGERRPDAAAEPHRDVIRRRLYPVNPRWPTVLGHPVRLPLRRSPSEAVGDTLSGPLGGGALRSAGASCGPRDTSHRRRRTARYARASSSRSRRGRAFLANTALLEPQKTRGATIRLSGTPTDPRCLIRGGVGRRRGGLGSRLRSQGAAGASRRLSYRRQSARRACRRA